MPEYSSRTFGGEGFAHLLKAAAANEADGSDRQVQLARYLVVAAGWFFVEQHANHALTPFRKRLDRIAHRLFALDFNQDSVRNGSRIDLGRMFFLVEFYLLFPMALCSQAFVIAG